MIKKMVLDTDKRRIQRRGQILILFSGGMSAAFSIILLMISARTVSIEETGILTIALAIAKLLMNVGKYGMRNYQVTETKQITFKEWLYSRYITTVLMLLCTAGCIGYNILLSGYSLYKAQMVLLICLLYAVECIEDVYTGYYQKMGRIDVSSLLQIMRYICLYFIYFAGLILTHNLLLSTIIALICSIVVLIMCTKRTLTFFETDKRTFEKNNIRTILKECFPLFLMSFILIYMSNAAKYEIDSVYDASVQAYYGFISTPIFAISLFSGFIFQPYLAELSNMWKECKINEFQKQVVKQFFLIVLISLISLLAGDLIGIPVLTWLFKANELYAYKKIFLILILGGGGTAIINFYTAILVIFRKQNFVLYAHVLLGISTFFTVKLVKHNYGIMGMTIGIMLLTWILAIVLYVKYKLIVRQSRVLKD